MTKEKGREHRKDKVAIVSQAHAPRTRISKQTSLKDVPSTHSSVSSYTNTSMTEAMSSGYSFSQASSLSNNNKNSSTNVSPRSKKGTPRRSSAEPLHSPKASAAGAEQRSATVDKFGPSSLDSPPVNPRKHLPRGVMENADGSPRKRSPRSKRRASCNSLASSSVSKSSSAASPPSSAQGSPIPPSKTLEVDTLSSPKPSKSKPQKKTSNSKAEAQATSKAKKSPSRKSKTKRSNTNSLHSNAETIDSAAPSYGSFSLGGGDSLSSDDTFQGSSSPSNFSSREVHLPNPAAKPAKAILKPNPNPNPVRPKQTRYHSPDESSHQSTRSYNLPSEESSSSSDSDEPEVPNQPVAQPSDSEQSDSESEATEDFNFLPTKSGSRSMREIEGQTSGEVSIATYSDEEDSTAVSDAQSLPSFPPVYQSGDSISTEHDVKAGTGTDSLLPPFENEQSWSNNMASKTSLQPGMLPPPARPNMPQNSANASANASNPLLYLASWSSDANWSKPADVREGSDPNWASGGSNYSQQFGGLTAWSSGDESSPSEEEEESARPIAPNKNKQRQPRSAYDKSAPWYCGDSDDDDSMNSDTSSVLSGLKKPTVSPIAEETKPFNPKFSDASMSFGDLVKPMSMSTDASSVESPLPEPANDAPPESSMSLGGLLINPNYDASVQVENKVLGNESSSLESALVDDFGESEENITLDSVEKGLYSSGSSASTGTPEATPEVTPEESSAVMMEETMSKAESVANTLLDSPWTRRTVLTGVVVFILFDVALALALIMR